MLAFPLMSVLFSCGKKITVDPGEKAVLCDNKGNGCQDTVIGYGQHRISNDKKAFIYDVREKEKEFDPSCLSSDDVDVHLFGTFRYRPIEEKLPYIQETFGKDYYRRLVLPEVRRAARINLGKLPAKEIDSASVLDLQKRIRDTAHSRIKKHQVILDPLKIDSLVKKGKEKKVKVSVERVD